MLRLGYGALLAFFGTVLVHIAVVFMVPQISESIVMNELRIMTQASEPALFSRVKNEDVAPSLDPFFRFRVCYFDLRDGNFQLNTNDSVPYFSATILSEKGDVLFSITDRQAVNNRLFLEARPESEKQRLSFDTSANSDATGAVPVFLPMPTGFAIVRAFVPDASYEKTVLDFLNSVECRTGQ